MTIARAFLADPSILILDEATSSVDSMTERLIDEALEQLYRDKTVIAIAHRLSTVRKADRILVMERGEVVESGTHEGLAARGGHYAALLGAGVLAGGAEQASGRTVTARVP